MVPTITWVVTQPEADQILTSLAVKPFGEVYQLFNKLQAQAQACLQEQAQAPVAAEVMQ